MVTLIRISIISALLVILSACAVYPEPYGVGYPAPVVARSRVVVGGGYYRPPPRVIIQRNFYGYGHPHHFQRFYGSGHGGWHGGYGHHR